MQRTGTLAIGRTSTIERARCVSPRHLLTAQLPAQAEHRPVGREGDPVPRPAVSPVQAGAILPEHRLEAEADDQLERVLDQPTIRAGQLAAPDLVAVAVAVHQPMEEGEPLTNRRPHEALRDVLATVHTEVSEPARKGSVALVAAGRRTPRVTRTADPVAQRAGRLHDGGACRRDVGHDLLVRGGDLRGGGRPVPEPDAEDVRLDRQLLLAVLQGTSQSDLVVVLVTDAQAAGDLVGRPQGRGVATLAVPLRHRLPQVGRVGDDHRPVGEDHFATGAAQEHRRGVLHPRGEPRVGEHLVPDGQLGHRPPALGRRNGRVRCEGLPLDATDEVVADAHPLVGRPEHELPRVEHEHAVLGHLDELGEVGLVQLHVDRAGRVVAEHPEQPAHAEVDRRRLHAPLVVGLDHDAAGAQRLLDRSVRQDHGGGDANRWPGRSRWGGRSAPPVAAPGGPTGPCPARCGR